MTISSGKLSDLFKQVYGSSVLEEVFELAGCKVIFDQHRLPMADAYEVRATLDVDGKTFGAVQRIDRENWDPVTAAAARQSLLRMLEHDLPLNPDFRAACASRNLRIFEERQAAKEASVVLTASADMSLPLWAVGDMITLKPGQNVTIEAVDSVWSKSPSSLP
jgi:hypothetical protein